MEDLDRIERIMRKLGYLWVSVPNDSFAEMLSTVMNPDAMKLNDEEIEDYLDILLNNGEYKS